MREQNKDPCPPRADIPVGAGWQRVQQTGKVMNKVCGELGGMGCGKQQKESRIKGQQACEEWGMAQLLNKIGSGQGGRLLGDLKRGGRSHALIWEERSWLRVQLWHRPEAGACPVEEGAAKRPGGQSRAGKGGLVVRSERELAG